ncbi:MAG: hypothetical protein M3Y67_05865 [Pseudomonadota bacterium]|nr:hypothetical protein [Pseudomonadota bacterium]
MVKGIRKALYCLLLIALPLQAFASGGLQHCMAMQMPLSHSADASATFGNDAAGIVLHDAQTSVSTAIHDCGGSAQGTQTSDRSAGHCAASAGCGNVAASMPALPLVMQVPDVIPAASPADPRVGFMTGAPERPPRTTA